MSGGSGENIFKHVAVYSGLAVELSSDQSHLLKIDFIKGNKKSEADRNMPAPVKLALSFLDDYFHGKNSRVEVLLQTGKTESSKNSGKLVLDVSGYTEKEISIYRELLNVPSGETVSYGELAFISGIPRGGRFAGNCMAANRFPIIIPCHRVIKRDGSIGNYSGGEGIKELLLKHEGAEKNKTIRLEKFKSH